MTDNYYVVITRGWGSSQYYSFAAYGHSPEECAQKLGKLTGGNPANGYVWCNGQEWDKACNTLSPETNKYPDRWEWLSQKYGSANVVYAHYPCDVELTTYLMYLEEHDIPIWKKDDGILNSVIYVSCGVAKFSEGYKSFGCSMQARYYAWLMGFAYASTSLHFSDMSIHDEYDCGSIIEQMVKEHVINGVPAHALERVQLIQRIAGSIIHTDCLGLKRTLHWMISDLTYSRDENITTSIKTAYDAMCKLYPELEEQESETN